MDYLLKVNILIAVFFLFYWLLLKPITFFKSNRWFLILGLILSLVLPLVMITNYEYYQPVNLENFTIQYSDTETNIQTNEEAPFNYLPFIVGIYSIVLTILTIKAIISIISVLKLISKAAEKNSNIIFTNQTNTTFSFFNRIIVNAEQFSEEELQLVLAHERVHVKQFHSFDILVAHLFTIVLWFNPLVWFYKKAIHDNLEFIADAEVIKQSNTNVNYQKLLLKTSLPQLQPIFSNTFYNSSIKNRIVMLNKKKTHQLLKLRYVLLMPAIAFFLIGMNTKTVYVPIENNQTSPEDKPYLKDIKVVFDKTLTQEQLESIKADLKKDGVNMVVKKISRNNKGEISEISVDFETKNGTAGYKASEPDGIEPFYFEMSAENGGFGVYSIKSDQKTSFRLKQAKMIKKPSYDADSLHYNYVISKSSQVFDNNDSITRINASNINSYATTKNQNIAVYINNKSSSLEALKNLEPINIESITVIKDKDELKKLNHEDKDSIIKIVLKNPWSVSINNHNVSENSINKNSELDNENLLNFKYEMSKHRLFLDKFKNDTNASNYSINPNNISSPAIIVYMLNGKIVDESQIQNLKQEQIKSVEVLKNKRKLDSMGYSSTDGIIEIKTNALSNHLLQNQKNNITYYRVDEAQYVDDKDPSKKNMTQYLYKETTNQDLQDQINKLKNVGVTMSYSKLKRNKNGHITNIKVKLQNKDGQEIEDTFSEKDGAVVMEYGVSNSKLKIAKLTE